MAVVYSVNLAKVMRQMFILKSARPSDSLKLKDPEKKNYTVSPLWRWKNNDHDHDHDHNHNGGDNDGKDDDNDDHGDGIEDNSCGGRSTILLCLLGTKVLIRIIFCPETILRAFKRITQTRNFHRYHAEIVVHSNHFSRCLCAAQKKEQTRKHPALLCNTHARVEKQEWIKHITHTHCLPTTNPVGTQYSHLKPFHACQTHI